MADQTVVVLGGSGFVGSRVAELWGDTLSLVAPHHADLDVLDRDALALFLEQTGADVVLNLAAWADVDRAEAQRGDLHGPVYRLNAVYPAELARLCGELHIYLLHVSTDYVFDGTNAAYPYREVDPTGPLGWYAETKLRGEQAIVASGASACIARIEMPFSGRPFPRRDFARTCVSRLRAGETIAGVVDQRITPVFLDDAIAAFALVRDARYTGLLHVASASWTTPFEYARSIAEKLGLDVELVREDSFEHFGAGRAAARPQNSWLDVSLFAGLFGSDVLRSVDVELDAWVAQLASVATRV